MAIHSFYVIAWEAGQPLYSRTWVEISGNPTLLSGLLASLELLSIRITGQHVNFVNLKDYRFYFKVDETNDILLVFITDTTEDSPRFQEYLEILNQRFLEIFRGASYSVPVFQQDETRIKIFDELVDSLVSNWESAEITLRTAKVMDVLEVFTLFYNVCLQKMLTAQSRMTYYPDIQDIFRRNTTEDPVMRLMTVNRQGVVFFDQVDPERVNLIKLPGILFSILRELITLIRRTRRRESYEELFFEHLVPLLKTQWQRLQAYELTADLVMELI